MLVRAQVGHSLVAHHLAVTTSVPTAEPEKLSVQEPREGNDAATLVHAQAMAARTLTL